MGDDVVNEIARNAFGLGDNGEGQLEFSAFFDNTNWETRLASVGKYVDFALDFKQKFETGMVNVREKNLSDVANCAYVIADELDKAIDDIQLALNMINVSLEIATQIFPEAVFVKGPIMAAVDKALKVVQVIEVICKILKITMDIVAVLKEKAKKEAREAYLSDNQEMDVSQQGMQNAIDALEKAQRSLDRAYASFRIAMGSYVKKIIEAILDEFGVDTEKVTIDNLSYASGCLYAGFSSWLMPAPGVLDDAQKLNAAITAIRDVIGDMGSIKVEQYDSSFFVNPSMLASAGSKGEVIVELIGKQKAMSIDSTDELFKAWKGPDAESQQKDTSKKSKKLDEDIAALKQEFTRLINIANSYEEFQKKAIDHFQYVVM